MPRLFANLGRSSKEHARAYNGYEGYDAPHGYVDDYGYEEQSPQPSSAWRKVFPRKLSRKVCLGSLHRLSSVAHIGVRITFDQTR